MSDKEEKSERSEESELEEDLEELEEDIKLEKLTEFTNLEVVPVTSPSLEQIEPIQDLERDLQEQTTIQRPKESDPIEYDPDKHYGEFSGDEVYKNINPTAAGISTRELQSAADLENARDSSAASFEQTGRKIDVGAKEQYDTLYDIERKEKNTVSASEKRKYQTNPR